MGMRQTKVNLLLAGSSDAAYTIAKLCVRLHPSKASNLLCDIPEIFHPRD
jgi:hypothetical protein